MNTENGTSLAVFQDNLITKYEKGEFASKEEMDRLTSNVWVKTAYSTAPSNLVVRHYCLIDLFKNNPGNSGDIKSLIYLIGKDLWQEGYSYWKYTKKALVPWAKKLYPSMITKIETIDKLFQQTAYKGTDEKLWPAPFGDLRKEPLEYYLQATSIPDSISAFPVKKTKLSGTDFIYEIRACPLGMNTHSPALPCSVRVSNGVPVNFKWYDGYDKKYPNKVVEVLDTIRPLRLFSIFRR